MLETEPKRPNMGSYKFEMEDVDLMKVPMAEVLETLRCDTNGLSTKAAEQRLALFGHNKFVVKQESKMWKFFGFMWNPLSWFMEAAAIMAIVLANGGGKPPDWQVFVGITVLLFINSLICFIEVNNAEKSGAALMAHLAPKTKVLRDGKWVEEDASFLVPGDVISIKLGDIIPADVRLLEGDALEIDQSYLTGESRPVTKRPGNIVLSGSTCKQGEIEAVVIATGVRTLFGALVEESRSWSKNQEVGRLEKVSAAIEFFSIFFITNGIFVEIMVMYLIQLREYRSGIDNLLVLLIGGIPIAMPTVLSITLANGSHRLSQQGAIIKRMTAIEEMARMDVLCINKTGTLTLNKLSVDRNLIEVFAENVEPDVIVLMAARASRVVNQDATDAAIVGMLADPKEARAGIQEIHFLPFNPTDKRTALTYIDNDGKMHRVSKGAPEQIQNLLHNKSEIERRVHSVIDNDAERGLRSLAVAYQEVPEGTKESPGDPWQLIGLMPLFDPLRHDSAETIRKALDLGVNVKMITGDQWAIGKETGRHLGMGTKMYPASALIRDGLFSSTKELIEKANGFTDAFPEHKHQIVTTFQDWHRHICGMIGDGVGDVPALKKANISIAFADATDAARKASDIVLAEPSLSVINSAVLTSRAIFQRIKNYTIYVISITVCIVLCFFLLVIIWNFDFPPFMVLIIAILIDGTVITTSKDKVKPSPQPYRWKVAEIFTTGIIFGVYLAMMTVIFFWTAYETDFFPRAFKVTSLQKKDVKDFKMLASAVFLQVSTSSQALIFVIRSRGWSYAERPGAFLMAAFVLNQMIATLIAVYANWSFAFIEGIGWRWAGVIWLYNLIFYIPLDPLKFFIRYTLSGKKKNFEREEHELRWAHALRTIHGLDPPETGFTEHNKYAKFNILAEDKEETTESTILVKVLN